ncbi:hypothetical protein [Thiocystis minor]|uniref:hypothetical protein n=1 Tax=Thiocystis minor TaxID=61597 RepID=UPI0019121C9B|nr:hypothetical protein [Thiocystis minor]
MRAIPVIQPFRKLQQHPTIQYWRRLMGCQKRILRRLQARMPQAGPQAQPFRAAREALCRGAAAGLRRTLAFEGGCVTSVMKVIDIQGVVVRGCGKFRKQICLPDDLLSGHGDWMPSFVQGTLNVQFSISQLPRLLQSHGLQALDLKDTFPPSIYRSGADVPGNTIQSNGKNPRQGDLQLWRAILINHQTQTKHKCFLIRRVKSRYRDKAEILGQHNFRENWKFADGHQVSIQVYSGAHET